MYGRVHTDAPSNIPSTRVEQKCSTRFISGSKIPYGEGFLSSTLTRTSHRAHSLKSYAHFFITTCIYSTRRCNPPLPVYVCILMREHGSMQTGMG